MKPVLPSQPNAFAAGSLDRAGHLREDAAWIEAAAADPASRYVWFWRGKARLAPVTAGRPPAAGWNWVFLGRQNNVPVFAADLSALDDPGEGFVDLLGWLRHGGTLADDDATLLATARAMLHWRRQNRYCAACGGLNEPTRAGHVLRCAACGTEHFPRTDPVVIMLVVKDHRVLLGQSLQFPPGQNLYSALAGFVEPGESLEAAVRREVFEETGVQVGQVHYHSCQPWPFPASLMLGFLAEALSEEIVLEAAEMRDARWFSRDELVAHEALGFSLPPNLSIGRRLIDDWLQAEPD